MSPFISYPEMQEELSVDGSRLTSRVKWAVDKFKALVGELAESIEGEHIEILEKEFSLPYFESVYDEHWNQEHGWSRGCRVNSTWRPCG